MKILKGAPRALASTVVMLGLLCVNVPVAGAQEPPDLAEFCQSMAIEVPATPVEGLVDEAVGASPMTCFPTEALLDAYVETLIASGSTVIGTEYSGASYTGNRVTITTSNSDGCLRGAAFRWKPSGSWVPGQPNAISSARSFQHCFSRHYESSVYDGSLLSIRCTCSAMSGMNNKTRSVRFASNP